MHRAYSLIFPCVRLLPCQTAIYSNRTLLQGFRIPNAARVNHTQCDKRLVHTGKTESQPTHGGNRGGGFSQAHSSENSEKNTGGFRHAQTVEVCIQGKTYFFDSLCLRDACPCERCIDQSTTQKLFDTLDIPTNIRGKDLEVRPDGSFSISWTSDIPGYIDHRSYYPPDWFKSKSELDHAVNIMRLRGHRRKFWRQNHLQNRRFGMNVTYDEYMTNEKGYHNVVRDLVRYGIAFIDKVPNALESVTEIGNRMGGLKNTIYGSTWDVRSLLSAKNVADTSSDLGLHMDLLYYKEPPKLQILHCLNQSDEGGESLFSDGFRAVLSCLMHLQNVRERSRFVVALTKHIHPFHYKNNGYWLRYSHPTLVIDEKMDPHTEDDWVRLDEYLRDPYVFCEALQAVRWSPPFQAPIARYDKDSKRALSGWIVEARRLRKQFNWKPGIYKTELKEGTCVIFDNGRILHGRTAFSGSERWLRGAYIDETTFTQQVLKLEGTQGQDVDYYSLPLDSDVVSSASAWEKH